MAETLRRIHSGPRREASTSCWNREINSLAREFLLRVVGARKADEPPVTEAEVTALLEAGTETGFLQPLK
jgi:hypothetical protein